MIAGALQGILTAESRSGLRELRLDPVEPEELEFQLGDIAMYAQPSYLPFARSSEASYALYVRPGASLGACPIVRLDSDNKDARILAGAMSGMRSAMLLVAGKYLDDWNRALAAVNLLGGEAVPLRPVSSSLLADVQKHRAIKIGLWSANAKEWTRGLWADGELEHPFAAAPMIDYGAPVDRALPVVETVATGEPTEPEVQSLLLCTRAKAGHDPEPVRVAQVLGAEAWRDRGLIIEGFWRVEGEGLCEWDATLQAAADVDGALTGPFERLRSNPRLYSGQDDEAVDVLVEVGREFERAGDWETALNQYRNAAAVAGLSGAYLGRVTRQEVHDAIANACDQIEPGCLAAEVARVSARAIAAGL